MEGDELTAAEISAAIQPYAHLLSRFASGEMSADEFEREYFAIYLELDLGLPRAVHRVVDGFFADVDAYVSDPDLRDAAEGDLDADELRARARALLRAAGEEV